MPASPSSGLLIQHFRSVKKSRKSGEGQAYRIILCKIHDEFQITLWRLEYQIQKVNHYRVESTIARKLQNHQPPITADTDHRGLRNRDDIQNDFRRQAYGAVYNNAVSCDADFIRQRDNTA
ncbi:hypothetical protein PUN28_001591 [Cardiocondyla obscurior]|uniref:Uncharacterized protein n=1 Tax=Cardiocondyla obscurior TaxID=286306 RepID=A0AAW2H5P2_9HYME